MAACSITVSSIESIARTTDGPVYCRTRRCVVGCLAHPHGGGGMPKTYILICRQGDDDSDVLTELECIAVPRAPSAKQSSKATLERPVRGNRCRQSVDQETHRLPIARGGATARAGGFFPGKLSGGSLRPYQSSLPGRVAPIIARRQKRCGMHWRAASSDALAAFKTLTLNREWDQYLAASADPAPLT